MLTLAELNKLYAEKLLKTGSHDAAIKKVAWVSFKAGLAEGKKESLQGS